MKIAPIALGILIAVALALPAILPKTFEVSRSQEISAPAARVFDFINNLDHWAEWTGLNAGDASVEYFFPLTRRGEGSILQWVGDAGTGQVVFGKQERAKEFEYNLYVDRDRDARGKITLVEEEGRTRLDWVVSGNLPYFRRYSGLFWGRSIGSELEASIGRLKQKLEAAP